MKTPDKKNPVLFDSLINGVEIFGKQLFWNCDKPTATIGDLKNLLFHYMFLSFVCFKLSIILRAH